MPAPDLLSDVTLVPSTFIELQENVISCEAQKLSASTLYISLLEILAVTLKYAQHSRAIHSKQVPYLYSLLYTIEFNHVGLLFRQRIVLPTTGAEPRRPIILLVYIYRHQLIYMYILAKLQLF